MTALFIADATPIYSTVLAEVGRPVLPRQTFERAKFTATASRVFEVPPDLLGATSA